MFCIVIFSTDPAELAAAAALSCTADTPVTQRAPSIFSPRLLSCLFVGDEEIAGREGGSMKTRMREGLRMKRGK